MDELPLYIIDTSSLISLHRWRPPSKHQGVWTKLDRLIRSDRLISPDEVYREIRECEDWLAKWALRYKRERKLFRRTTKQHATIAKQIVREFPDFVERDRPLPQADPFVVALAKHESYQMFSPKRVVVTEEKYVGTGRPRIPHVCASYQILYLSIHQVYVAEGWPF